MRDMRRYRVDNCSIERTLAVLGEKWTLLVLREAFTGVRRFADLQSRTGAPRQVLSARLSRLVDEGLLRKVPYQEPGQRQRDEYRLTQKGLDLYPILIALMHWGDRYLADSAGPPVVVTHRDCGAPVALRLLCADGHEVGGPREATPAPAPAPGSAPPPDRYPTYRHPGRHLDRHPERRLTYGPPIGLPRLVTCTGSSSHAAGSGCTCSCSR